MLPSGIFVAPRLAGYATVAAGITALGIAVINDPADRRRVLTRFAIAHLIFGFVFFGVTDAILGSFFPALLSWVPLMVGALLTYLALTASSLHLKLLPRPLHLAGDPPLGPVVVERSASRVDPLRTQYDEQIRRAAQQEERARLATCRMPSSSSSSSSRPPRPRPKSGSGRMPTYASSRSPPRSTKRG
jgi:hypothetical protein